MNATTTKAAASVTEVANMVRLSRSRFYQLVGSAFPPPVYDRQTRRPFYTAEQQEVCLEVRRRNCGIDGQPILFYASRPTSHSVPRKNRKPMQKSSKPAGRFRAVLDGVRALGLLSASERQIEQAVGELFPTGTADVEPGEIIRAIFVHLMRRNPADNVGR